MKDNTSPNKMQAYRKQENKEEMKKMLISFGMMILFTIIAFALVGTGVMKGSYLVILLFLMALVQVMFQFLYFMHMQDKGHEEASGIIYGAFWVTFLVMMGLGVITWS